MSEPNRKSDYLGAKKSLVRIRLESPDKQAPTSWIQGSQQGVAPLASSLDTSYAWFGIVKRGKGLPDRSGIQPAPAKEGTRLLRLAVPAEYMPQLEETLSLVDYFGLLGSRSRGGWGALHVEGVTPMSETQIGRYARPLDACLQDDWPMSLAADDHGPCVWHSKGTFKSWDTAMRFIAAERKLVRTNLKDLGGKDLRPALGFASTGRMPSPLRWKVVPDGNALKVRIFAMPHRIPDDGGRKMHLSDLQIAWRSVCNALNTNPAFVPRNQ